MIIGHSMWQLKNNKNKHMKIFYAVQATGNGHISRAIQLMPYLE